MYTVPKVFILILNTSTLNQDRDRKILNIINRFLNGAVTTYFSSLRIGVVVGAHANSKIYKWVAQAVPAGNAQYGPRAAMGVASAPYSAPC